MDPPSAGGSQSARFIPEADVYRLVMRSKLPEAEKFQDWVCEEVLPSIRQHGTYMSDDFIEDCFNDPDMWIKTAQRIKDERRKRREAEALAAKQKIQIEEQKAEIVELKDRSAYVEIVLLNPELVCVSQIAQDYGMSAIAFNQILRQIGVQYKINGQWILYAAYKDKGYVQSVTICDDYGYAKMWTYWTQAGRLFLYKLLKQRGMLPKIEQDTHQTA